MKRHFFPILLALILLLCGCGGESYTEKNIFAMDTYMTLRVYDGNADAALSDAIATINAASTALDPELESSEVYAINHAEGRPITVSPMVAEMLTVARTVYDRSEGALDLTIYPVVKAWGFIDQSYTVPDTDTLTALQKLPRFDAVTVDIHTLTMPAGMELSFGSMAKGAVAEQCRELLKEYGVTSAYLSLGGNVQTVGLKPDGSKWRIGVQDPNHTAGYLGVVTVGEAAVVTSGSYQRYFEQDGRVYHHIIDPETCVPSESGLVSVTIVCDSGTMADALSTAMFILGEDDALAYRSIYGGFDMILVTADGRVVVTDGLEFEESADGYVYEYVK